MKYVNDILCKHPVDFLVVLPYTQNNADNDVHTEKCGTSGAYERQRNTNYRHYLKYHSDVHGTVRKQHGECTHANIFSQFITCSSAVSYYLYADKCKNKNKGSTAYKSEYIAYIGENEVIVNLRNITFSVSEETFSENITCSQGRKSEILLPFYSFRIASRIEKYHYTFLLNRTEKILPGNKYDYRNCKDSRYYICNGEAG